MPILYGLLAGPLVIAALYGGVWLTHRLFDAPDGPLG